MNGIYQLHSLFVQYIGPNNLSLWYPENFSSADLIQGLSEQPPQPQISCSAAQDHHLSEQLPQTSLSCSAAVVNEMLLLLP